MSESSKESFEEIVGREYRVQIPEKEITCQRIVDNFTRALQQRTKLHLDKVKVEEHENKEELADTVAALKGDDLVKMCNKAVSQGFFEMTTNQQLSKAKTVTQEYAKSFVDKALEDMVDEVMKGIANDVEQQAYSFLDTGKFVLTYNPKKYPQYVRSEVEHRLIKEGWEVSYGGVNKEITHKQLELRFGNKVSSGEVQEEEK